jgi:hypothetical protein
MDTEEKHNEFYNLNYAMNDSNNRDKKRNAKPSLIDKQKSGLQDLYHNDDGIVSIGHSNTSPWVNDATSIKNKKSGKYGKSQTIKKQSTGWVSLTGDNKSSFKMKKKAESRVQRIINEDDEENEFDSDIDKEKEEFFNQQDGGSIMDPDQDPYLANDGTIGNKTKDDSDAAGKTSSKISPKLDSEDEKKMDDDLYKGSNSSSGNKINKWKDPNNPASSSEKMEESGVGSEGKYHPGGVEDNDVKLD